MKTLDLLGRQTVVLVFLDAWPPPDASALSAIRAELRGLGAVLAVLARDATWVFRPDDDLERWGELDAKSLDVERAGFGLRPCERGLLVLDEDRRVRTKHVWKDEGVDLATLASALGEAGRAVLLAPRGVAVSRRELVAMSLVAAFALVLEGCGRQQDGVSPAASSTATSASPPAGEVEIMLDVNGAQKKVRVDPRTTVLDALRERLSLTGTKKGCDHGQCGACTVLMDGRRVKSCMLLAMQAEGSKLQTIEGVASGDTLHPLQQAFVTEDALQCGYCTPGQIMSALGLYAEGDAKTDDEVRLAMSGNICRCGAYPNIVRAIQSARSRERPREQEGKGA